MATSITQTVGDQVKNLANACPICSSTENRVWEAREMMFGLRDPFSYLECRGCSCLRIEEIPADLSRYYPSNYYSLENRPQQHSRPREWLRNRRNEYAFTGKGILGRILQRSMPHPIAGVDLWLQTAGRGKATRILDVGCGAGTLIHDLALAGFERPLGVDPFVESDLHYPAGATVLKKELADLKGEFDLIIMNHSLEHVPDPIATLTAARRLLAPEGICVAKMPTVTSFAWEHYRTDWFQLDAPRHLLIHSLDSMGHSAERAGLQLIDVQYNSTELQFIGSELYRRDVAFNDGHDQFTPAEIRDFRKRAAELNRSQRGDQASFFMRRAVHTH